MPGYSERAAADHATLRDAPAWCYYIVVAGCATWVIAVIAAVVGGSFYLFGAVLQIPLWALVTVPIARRLARSERDPGVFGFVMAAFAAKMFGVLVRQAVAFGVYNGVSDANAYDKAGRALAPFYRRLDFSPDTGKLVGTGFLKALTGVVYALMGSSQLGAFVFFAFLSFLGLLLLWRAFRLAVPNGDGRRYGLLVLFLPSLLYWPSALGKEGWSLLCVGLVSYGVALLLTKKVLRGILFLAAGLVGVSMLRPHIALVVFGGLILTALLAKPRSSSPSTPIIRVVVFGALFVLGLVLVSQAQSFLGVSSLDQGTVNKKLDKTTHQTAKEAGSRFSPARIHSPIDVPYATITVLFRPLPWEAPSGQELATSLENVFLLVLTVRSWRRLRSIPREARVEPYIAYCIGFCAMFVFAFSSFSNFGILARQRTQAAPLFLALLCLPVYRPSWKDEWSSSTAAVETSPDDPDHDTQTTDDPARPDPYARFGSTSERDRYARFGSTSERDPYARFGSPSERDPYARFRDGSSGSQARAQGRDPSSRDPRANVQNQPDATDHDPGDVERG